MSAIGIFGESAYSGIEEFKTGTGIDAVNELDGIPKEYALYQDYANSFNPTTTIAFEVPLRHKLGGISHKRTIPTNEHVMG